MKPAMPLLVAAVAVFGLSAWTGLQEERTPEESECEACGAPCEPSVPLGLRVPASILLLRAQALDGELEHARPALEQLGRDALDRVTVELLLALARGRDAERRQAAGLALVAIGERAAEAGHRELAGRIGEALYLSSQPAEVRSRAHSLFMLLDTERARRHR